MLFKFVLLLLVIGTLAVPVKKESTYSRDTFYNHKYFEGDILSYATGTLKYHAVPFDGSLWPNNEVVYQIDSMVDQGLVISAMQHITQSTGGCIKFREKQDTDTDYVNIFSGEGGCYSEVGKKGGEQQLSLGNGCGAIGVYIHELLHTLGFYHHHSRSDRDEYLDIFWENIIPNLAQNFRKLDSIENKLLTPFDYQSIMMYGSLAFSKDNVHYTMLPKDYSIQISDPGTKSGMTSSDITALKKLYSCDSTPNNDLEDNNKNGFDKKFEEKWGENQGNNEGDNQGDSLEDKFGDHNIIGQDDQNDKPILPPIPSFPDVGNPLPPIPSLTDFGKETGKNKLKPKDLKGFKNMIKIDKMVLPDLRVVTPNLPDPNVLDLNESYEKESNNHVQINELTGQFGELGNMIDFSKVIGSIMKLK